MKTLYKIFLLIMTVHAPIAFTGCSDDDQPEVTIPTEKVKTLRVLYNNILFGMVEDQANNYDNWVEWVKKYDPDICVWCEGHTLFKDDKITPVAYSDEMYLPTHWPELAARYGHNYTAIPYITNAQSIVTSKYPIELVDNLATLNFYTTAPGGHYRIKINGKTFNIVPLHLSVADYALDTRDREKSIAEKGGDKWRAREIEYICKNTIQKSSNAENEYWIMAGDFNSPNFKEREMARNTGCPLWAYPLDDEDPKYLVSKYIYANTCYEDVIRAMYPHEFINTTAYYRNDFMYVSPQLIHRLMYSEVIVDEFIGQPNNDGISKFTGSDHLPVMADFDFSR